MPVLIDECVDERIRHLFPNHECVTARFAGFAGHGHLFDAAEAAGFGVLITVDQNILEQQNMSARRISMMILCGPTNRLSDLERLVPAAMLALDGITPGAVLRIRESPH